MSIIDLPGGVDLVWAVLSLLCVPAVTWFKATKAAAYAGGISPKVLYSAVRAGKLRAAKIGAGRNLLFCEAFIDEWLRATVEPVARSKETGR